MRKFFVTIFVVLSNYAYSCLVYANCVGISKSEPPAQITDKKLLFHSGPNRDNKYKYLSCGDTTDKFLDCAINTQSIGADGHAHKCTINGWETIPFSDIEECESINKFAQIYDAATGTGQIATKLGLEYVLAAETDVQLALKNICKYKLIDYQAEEDKCMLNGGDFLSYGEVCDITRSSKQQIDITDDDGNQLTNVIVTAINLNTPTKLSVQQDSTTGRYPLQIDSDYSGLKFEFSKTGHESVIKTGDELIKNPNVILPSKKSETTTTEIFAPEEKNPLSNDANTNETPNPNQNQEISDKLKSARDALAVAKEKENSWANRALGATTTAATSLGAMQLAEGIAEKKADEEAEKQMRNYISTMKCEYGGGKHVDFGVEETLPGGNELFEYYTEYKTLADNLKTTKAALGLGAGIESEVLYDRAQSGLYQYANAGKTGGGETSLYRALTDSESADATAWSEQKETASKKLKVGGVATAVGVGGGAVGNYFINDRNKKD